MSAEMNPLAPHTLPWFVTAPGATDTLYVITTIIVIFAVVMLGVFFFWLHSLPERMGHKKLQFEIVAVLGLISLFTHMHVFWIIGLLLAVIDLPDFIGPAAPHRGCHGKDRRHAARGEPAARPPNRRSQA